MRSEDLRSPEKDPRLVALAELVKPENDAAPFLADVAVSLEYPADDVRKLAVAVLGRIGAPAVAALTRALAEDQGVEVRTFAAQALATIGPDAAPATRELCRALTSPEDGLRSIAARTHGSASA